MNKPTLCIADFDDTLILTDSLKTIMLSEHWLLSPAVLLAGVRLFFSIKLHKNELASRSRFKLLILKKYEKLPDEKRKAYIEKFKGLINKVVTDMIREQSYDRIVIVSASEDSLVRNVIDGCFDRYEVIANSVSSDFTTCYGKEKVRRLKELIPEPSDYIITTFTDSYSDSPLIELSDNAYMVKETLINSIK